MFRLASANYTRAINERSPGVGKFSKKKKNRAAKHTSDLFWSRIFFAWLIATATETKKSFE